VRGRGNDVSRLDGKVAVVTGAASGIGLATTRLFAQEGAKVLALDVEAASLQEAVGGLGPAVLAFPCDVTDEAAMTQAMATADKAFGGIDTVIANAGIFGDQALIEDHPIENISRVMNVNVNGTVITIKSAIPFLTKRGGGSIVITSSLAAVMGNPKMLAYCASKHALTGVMRVAAKELAPRKIRVNTVNPGLVDTDMMRKVEASICPDDPLKGRAQLQSEPLIPAYVQPSEVAELMLYLSSDAAVNCTGGIYMIDGGQQHGGGQRML
jgi:NAD(P)-dependent dehydrogenase (short-subunit alcohol dehydrogenase family)